MTMKPILFLLATSTFFLAITMADPRTQTVQLICRREFEMNYSKWVINSVATMENISSQLQTSRFGMGVAGLGSDACYGMAQCYGDLSSLDCALCYSAARTVLPQCFPDVGGRIFLDGCFVRGENYSFYEEYKGPEDRVLCENTTNKDPAFQDAVRQAAMQAASNAPTSRGYARAAVPVKGTTNESVYVLANCWETLNVSSCGACLQNASSMIQGCLPRSEGRALNAGCFMRYSDYNFLNNEPKTSSKGVVIAAVSSVVSSLVVLTVGAATGAYLWKLRMKRKKRRVSGDAEKLVQILHDSSLNFRYSTLERATRSFAEDSKLGQGGFGTVYKGVLPDGREIAVKRLYFNNKHRVADFYNEVNIISILEHKNLVRLLGCSCSGPESLLVYEYLPNKSLDRFIFDPIHGKMLNWHKRYEIIIGTAEGLVYLHENRNVRIIHRDIKASNILLDSRFHAKIADFGLARSFQEDKSHISTAIAGTLGYMAPEYLAHGQLTEKADVYSFGVLLLEIVTGRKNNRGKTLEDLESLLTASWKHFQQGTAKKLFDSNLTLDDDDEGNIKDEILRVMHIGLLCTQESPKLRPSMSRALQMLRKKNERLPAPTGPPFANERTMELNDLSENPCYPLIADSSAFAATATFSTLEGR
ncbi:Cell division control protein 2 [Ancistrocladus abbreviatus]